MEQYIANPAAAFAGGYNRARRRNALANYAEQYPTAEQPNLTFGNALAGTGTVAETPELSYGGNPDEIDWLARAIYSEAGQESQKGQLAVGSVIANRVKSGRWGDSFEDVILAPGQFSAFNGLTGYAGGQGANDLWKKQPPAEVYDIARTVMSGGYSDPTGGALNYYNPAAANPAWGSDDWQRIGNHVFGTAGG